MHEVSEKPEDSILVARRERETGRENVCITTLSS